MFEGRVQEIWIRDVAEGPMRSVEEAKLIAGRGIEGDDWLGSSEGEVGPGKQVTLVEQEAIDAAAAAYRVELDPGATRRNVVTVGVPLNHLVDREFSVGEVVLRGVRLCEPCGLLQEMTGQPMVNAFRHRGGLRADIVKDGVIRAGDVVRPS